MAIRSPQEADLIERVRNIHRDVAGVMTDARIREEIKARKKTASNDIIDQVALTEYEVEAAKRGLRGNPITRGTKAILQKNPGCKEVYWLTALQRVGLPGEMYRRYNSFWKDEASAIGKAEDYQGALDGLRSIKVYKIRDKGRGRRQLAHYPMDPVWSWNPEEGVTHLWTGNPKGRKRKLAGGKVPKTLRRTMAKRKAKLKQNPEGVIVPIKDLPKSLRDVLGDHKGRDIEIIAAETFRPMEAAASGSGYQGYVTVVNLVTGESRTRRGDWGGVGLGTMAKRARGELSLDEDDSIQEIPINGAIVLGQRGGNYPFARIKVHPETFTAMLPEAADVTPYEKVALSLIYGIKGSYRKDLFEQIGREFPGIGPYDPNSPVIQSLAEKGLLKINKRGAISVTTAGKNAAGDGLDSRYGAERFFAEHGIEPQGPSYNPKNPLFGKKKPKAIESGKLARKPSKLKMRQGWFDSEPKLDNQDMLRDHYGSLTKKLAAAKKAQKRGERLGKKFIDLGGYYERGMGKKDQVTLRQSFEGFTRAELGRDFNRITDAAALETPEEWEDWNAYAAGLKRVRKKTHPAYFRYAQDHDKLVEIFPDVKMTVRPKAIDPKGKKSLWKRLTGNPCIGLHFHKDDAEGLIEALQKAEKLDKKMGKRKRNPIPVQEFLSEEYTGYIKGLSSREMIDEMSAIESDLKSKDPVAREKMFIIAQELADRATTAMGKPREILPRPQGNPKGRISELDELGISYSHGERGADGGIRFFDDNGYDIRVYEYEDGTWWWQRYDGRFLDDENIDGTTFRQAVRAAMAEPNPRKKKNKNLMKVKLSADARKVLNDLNWRHRGVRALSSQKDIYVDSVARSSKARSPKKAMDELVAKRLAKYEQRGGAIRLTPKGRKEAGGMIEVSARQAKRERDWVSKQLMAPLRNPRKKKTTKNRGRKRNPWKRWEQVSNGANPSFVWEFDGRTWRADLTKQRKGFIAEVYEEGNPDRKGMMFFTGGNYPLNNKGEPSFFQMQETIELAIEQAEDVWFGLSEARAKMESGEGSHKDFSDAFGKTHGLNWEVRYWLSPMFKQGESESYGYDEFGSDSVENPKKKAKKKVAKKKTTKKKASKKKSAKKKTLRTRAKKAGRKIERGAKELAVDVERGAEKTGKRVKKWSGTKTGYATIGAGTGALLLGPLGAVVGAIGASKLHDNPSFRDEIEYDFGYEDEEGKQVAPEDLDKHVKKVRKTAAKIGKQFIKEDGFVPDRDTSVEDALSVYMAAHWDIVLQPGEGWLGDPSYANQVRNAVIHYLAKQGYRGDTIHEMFDNGGPRMSRPRPGPSHSAVRSRPPASKPAKRQGALGRFLSGFSLETKSRFDNPKKKKKSSKLKKKVKKAGRKAKKFAKTKEGYAAGGAGVGALLLGPLGAVAGAVGGSALHDNPGPIVNPTELNRRLRIELPEMEDEKVVELYTYYYDLQKSSPRPRMEFGEEGAALIRGVIKDTKAELRKRGLELPQGNPKKRRKNPTKNQHHALGDRRWNMFEDAWDSYSVSNSPEDLLGAWSAVIEAELHYAHAGIENEEGRGYGPAAEEAEGIRAQLIERLGG